MYLYYGGHWSGSFLSSSTYAFSPVIYNGTGLSLHKTGGWALDAVAGTWYDLAYATVTAAASTTQNATLVKCNDLCAGGMAVNLTSTQVFTFTCSGGAGAKVLGIQYDYNGPKNDFRHVAATVDGVAAGGSALCETSRSYTTPQEAPLPVTLAVGSNVTLYLLDYGGVESIIDSVKIYDFESLTNGSDVAPTYGI